MKSESVLSELHLANETNVPKKLFFYWFTCILSSKMMKLIHQLFYCIFETSVHLLNYGNYDNYHITLMLIEKCIKHINNKLYFVINSEYRYSIKKIYFTRNRYKRK